MKLRVVVVTTLVLFFGLMLSQHRGDPGRAVHAYLETEGWDVDDIAISRGGFSTSWFGSKSYLQFRSKSDPERGEFYAEVERGTPFSPWHLSEFRVIQ